MMVEENQVQVSVLTTTYNHERYIAQTVESVMGQVTDFGYEHVIGEDCSTDRTRAILLDLQRQHPDKIRLLLREKNMGRRANFIDTFHACRGQYIAFLEGDDYWSSPHKLQRQVDLLDSHPDLALCFHPVTRYYEDEDREQLFFPEPIQDRYHLVDLLERNFIPACSVMFRNHLFDEFPDWFWHVPAGDLPLHVLNAQHGDIGYIHEVMAVHRVQRGGVWSHKPGIDRLRDLLVIQHSLQEHLGPAYANRMHEAVASTHLKMIRAFSLQHDWSGMVRHGMYLLFRAGLPLPCLLRATRRTVRSFISAREGAGDS